MTKRAGPTDLSVQELARTPFRVIMLTTTTLPAPLPGESVGPPCLSRVLVVDDSRSIRAAFTRILGRSGFLVETAATVAEALRRAIGWRPDVIILDLQLDGEDGRVFLRLLRARVGGRMPQVLICSGGDTALPEHASALLAKPFRVEDAIAAVRELARRARAKVA